MNPDEMMPPNLKIILDEVKADIFSTFNCIQIGKISKVTSSEQTVEIELQIKRLAADGTSTAYPVLVDCPYFVLQGGGAYIDMPIKQGDYCIVLFNDRYIDNWWSTANVADPATARKHSLSDALAIVGLNPKTSPLDMDGSLMGFRAGTHKIMIENNAEKFSQWISDFVDALVAIKTFGSPPAHTLTPDTITALNALKTRAGNLFGGS